MKIDKDFYKKHPRTCDPEDFWGQVMRTVNGEPITQEQIDMIVSSVCEGLKLSGNDRLLDLCCGNGALSDYFFNRCESGLGVDSSEYLIEVAKRHFSSGHVEYILGDIVETLKGDLEYKAFTKALCYGSIQYLPRQTVYELLKVLREKFASIDRFFIGNVPDRDFMCDFFGDNYEEGIENEHASPIGVWWTSEELGLMAEKTGWRINVSRMPKEFYASHYRFDAVLMPE